MSEPSETPQFVEPHRRTKTLPLAYPVTIGGKVLSEIVLQRMTAGDVAAYTKAIEAKAKENPDAFMRFPIFHDAEGKPIADAVFDALDSDDHDMLQEHALDFLPRRFRPISTTSEAGSRPVNGAPIEPSSET
jgi:hypothetical protein